MLDTYSHLPLSAPKVQHSADDDHRHTRNSPQRNSFENSNTDDYFRSFKTDVPGLRTTADQELLGIVTIEYHQNRALVDHIDHELTNTQFEASALGAFPRFEHVSRVSRFSVNFGFLTKSPSPAEWLEELLNEFKEFSAYAQDEDIEEPSEVALSKAKNLLKEISFYVFDRPDVYPMQERCIAIDFRGPESKSGVLFVIEQDGSGALYRRTENSRGRLRVDDAADLLSEGGIMELKRVGIR